MLQPFQRSLAFFLIKPHVPRCLHVGLLQRLLIQLGPETQITHGKYCMPKWWILDRHLHAIEGHPFYTEVRAAMAAGPSYACILRDTSCGSTKTIHERLADATGPTDPADADRSQIRGMYGVNATLNVCHRSMSSEEALFDIQTWLPRVDLGNFEDLEDLQGINNFDPIFPSPDGKVTLDRRE